MTTNPHGPPAVDDLRVETSSTTPPEANASLSDLISRLGDDVTLLFRQEVELAKIELKREATTAAKASGMFVAAGVAGLVTLLLLAWAAAWGLAEILPAGLAFWLSASSSASRPPRSAWPERSSSNTSTSPRTPPSRRCSRTSRS